MWLMLAVACDLLDDPAAVEWQIAPADLGDARVAGTGFDATAGDTLGAAFPQVMPGWAAGANPAWDVPTTIWGYAMADLVADEGACPYVELEGADQHFKSDCRSQDGYDWSGTVVEAHWDEGDVAYTRYDFDVDVVADVADARFDRLGLHGSVQLDDGGAFDHVDVNLEAELLGYFEAREQADDPRVATWAAWAASGSVELDDEALQLDLAADVGGSDGFRLTGTDLAAAASCPVEPSGTAEMGEGVTAEFEGAKGCDACATVHGPDGDTSACAPPMKPSITRRPRGAITWRFCAR